MLAEVSKRNAPCPSAAGSPFCTADPAYAFNMTSTGDRAPENYYVTLPLEEICALDVRRITAPAVVLFLWVPSPLLMTHAPAVLDAWGFTYRVGLVWDKVVTGMGFWVRQQHEHLLIATCGDMPAPLPQNRPP
jgi:N6-adenosine-specific RNA methylase IME4